MVSHGVNTFGHLENVALTTRMASLEALRDEAPGLASPRQSLRRSYKPSFTTFGLARELL